MVCITKEGKILNVKKVLATLLCLTMATTVLPTVAYAETGEKAESYDIYVTVSGSDTKGDGSKTKPYATIEKAKEEARKRNDKGTVTVSIGEGKYFIENPIQFDAEDSNVTYVGDNAILTGAKTLTNLEWKDYENEIKVADVDPGLGIDQLFIDGSQQILARYPNYDAGQALQGCTTQANIKKRSEGWSNPKGGYIRALHNHKWGGNSYVITGKDASAMGLSYTWIGDNNRGSGLHTDNIMVENIFEELDSPGEWYYNDETGKLYLWPQEGIDLSQVTVEGAVTEELLHVEGTQDGAQVQNLVFDGLTLENTKRTMFTGQYVPLMRSDWCVVRSGALFIQDAENVSFQNGTIRNIGGNGVFLSGHSQNVKIHNNEILNIGSSGVLAAGFPDSCREPSFWENPPATEIEPLYIHKTTIDDKTSGPVKEHYPREAVISNNHIQNVGIWEKQSSQVALSVAYKMQIIHNTIHEGPRAGVNVGDGTFGGHEIAYNDIFDVQRETDDHGMFNSWGRDRFWSLGGFDTMGNKGAQKEPYSLIDVIEPIQIHDNRMHFAGRVDGGSTFGIDLDDGSSNYKIYNNLCLNMGIKLREGFHREVYNNILVNGAFNLHCTFEDSYDVIEKNIVVKGTPYVLAATDANRFKVSEDKIDNNWFYDLGMKVNCPNFWENLSYDANSVTADPQFQNTSENDYTVTNTEIMDKIGFENFPMDQFGKPGCPYQAPVYEKTEPDGNTDILEREEWLGATISALDDAIMSSTGAGSLDGVYLESVPENSQAAAFGLKAGDVIKAVNGKEIGKKSNFIPLYNNIENGILINMKLIRNQLAVDLNFIKSAAIKEIVIDDQDESVIYKGGEWETSTPDKNPSNSVNCMNKTMKYINMDSVEDKSAVCVEVPFTGSQIEFISRKERNMGEYSISIKDSKATVLQSEICSANNGGDKKDQCSIFKSKVFPEGNYIMEVKWKSGDYFIVDAFKVRMANQQEVLPIVVEPVLITEDGVRVTELLSGKALNIEVPIVNNGSQDVNVTASVALSGNEGVLQLESLAKRSQVIKAGQSSVITLNVNTPEGSESKRLEVFVYQENGAVYSYPTVIDGMNIVAKDVNIMDAFGEKIEYTYTEEERLLTIAAKDLAVGAQGIVEITDEEGNVIGFRQRKIEDGGQLKAAFILPEKIKGNINVCVRDEKGSFKEVQFEIKEGENILDKSALQETIKAAKIIIEDETATGKYTKDSWMEFYNAYMEALERLESNKGTQEEVNQKTNILIEKMEALQLLVETEKFNPSQSNLESLYQIYRADGTKDGGNRDGKGGDQWQVRASQIDATIPGAYAEFKGNYSSFKIGGANKYDSSDFKVVITDDATGEVISEEQITQSKSEGGNTVQIYSKEGLSGKPQTIRVYHTGAEGEYLELREIEYTVMKENAEKIPSLEKITITKLPDTVKYVEGFEGEISLLGGQLTETYSDGSTNIVPMNSTMYRSGFDTSKVGKQTITAEHRGKSFEIEIEIEKKAVEVNKEILKEVVARAEKVKLKDYVNAGQEEFVKALDDARLILQKENATQQEVDEVSENLENAMESLKRKADKTELNAILEEIKSIDFSQYTKESVEVLDKVLVKANKVMADENLSVDNQKQVEDVVKELKAAMENLKLKTPDTDGSDNTGSKPNNNKEDGNQNNSKAESQAVKTGDQGNVLMQAILVLFAALSAVLLVKKRYNK